MFPTHTSRRTRGNNIGTTNEHSYSQQAPPQSWDYQSSPPYTQQYPPHTAPSYAYPTNKYNGGSDGGSAQPYQERAPYPQWNPSKLNRGYDRDYGSQDGNYLDGSQHSYRANSEGESEYHRQQEISPQTENPPPPVRDPSARYQQYQYQNSFKDTQSFSTEPASEYPPNQPSNRYYSQETPAEYQPYIPERPPRVNTHATYNKWTPPARLQQFTSPDTYLQAQQENQAPVYSPPPTEIPHHTTEPTRNSSVDLPQKNSLQGQNGSSDQKYYPGHPAYKWTPPVVLQVFQDQPMQYPEPPVNSKYVSHMQSHATPDTHAVSNQSPQAPPPIQTQGLTLYYFIF